MKHPSNMTTEAIKAEIEKHTRKPYNGKAKWAMRLFDLRQELKSRTAALLKGGGE